MTKIFNDTDVRDAADLIRAGGLVAVPTETVYGLAANGMDASAVEKIYEVKGRPSIKPLSLMVSDCDALLSLCMDVPVQAYWLAQSFWPGPLTIVLNANNTIPDIVRAGGSTIGLRCPAHPLTLSLISSAGVPLAAPSANPSGAKSPKTCAEVLGYFEGKIEGILDGGECRLGVESTIIDLHSVPFQILRKGALNEQEISDALMRSMTILGITGGTGCGKTTALTLLKEHDFLVIDADAVYHQLLSENQELHSELRAHFPGAYSDVGFDRKALGRIVFQDNTAMLLLNKISHRYVCDEIYRMIRKAAFDGYTRVAIDAIELFSSGLNQICTNTLAVTAERETRIARIMKRDRIDRGYAEMRIDAQHNSVYFENNCDFVLDNDSTEEAFRAKCLELLPSIIQD